jgi:DNA-directed RNA polymerase subunit K/omega
MSDANPTERMHLLWDSVRQALRDLDAGKLDLDGLERASTDAQALYERLIVLRHKAREAKRTAESIPPVAKEPPPVIAPAEIPNLRLDTRPTEVTLRQTSLIDAIAETETPPAPKAPRPQPPPPAPPAPPPAAPVKAVRDDEPPKPAATDGSAPPKVKPPKPVEKAPKGPSLGDKLESAPVADLHKAIALSQKFWFVAELFGGQRERYEKAIDAINASGSIDEARAFVSKEIIAKATRPPAEDALQAFTELVDRRFR